MAHHPITAGTPVGAPAASGPGAPPPDGAGLSEALRAVWPGMTFEAVEIIDSTNTELMRRARDGDSRPVLLVARRQTAGRGRLGRAWHSEGAAALTFSVSVPLAPRQWSGLSLAVGVALAEALDVARGPAPGEGVRVKWPNDLWWHGRKLGGILIETAQAVGHGIEAPAGAASVASRQVVVGVGLNVGPRPAEGLATPPAWAQEFLPGIAPPALLRMLAPALLQALAVFGREGFAPWRPRFAARDALDGRAVALPDGASGVAGGVDADGALLVHTETGMRTLHSDEVSVRPQAGGPAA